MKPIQNDYTSFLLRMWRVSEADGEQWRASLQEIQSGELRGFPDLGELLAYLEKLAATGQKSNATVEQQQE